MSSRVAHDETRHEIIETITKASSVVLPSKVENEEVISRRGVIKQVLAGLAIASSTLMTGFTSAWPVVLPKLQESSQSFQVTDQDVAWLVSLQGMVGMFTSLVSGHLVEYFGPRRLLLMCLLPTFGLWMLMAFTPYLSLLYISRVGLSISTYLIKSFFQAYIAELCQPRIRGAIAALPEIIIAIGVLATYTLANFFSYEFVTAVLAAPFLPLFIIVIFIPESPYWLARRNRMEEAKSSLKKLRGEKDTVERELHILTNTNKAQSSAWTQVHELKKGKNIRPVLFVLAILALREISGQTAVFSYSVYMFRQAGIELDAFLCTVFIGCVRLICSFVAAGALDCAGRRPFLIGSSVICGLAELISGVAILLNFPGTSWIPLSGLLIYVAAYGLGQGSIPWILMGELLPTPVRSIGSSIITFSYCTLLFIVNLLFFRMTESLSLGGALCLFSMANLVLAVVTFVWLPETRGKSLDELETAFTRPRREQQFSQEVRIRSAQAVNVR
ncbi:facilitated trehalose transporter Tret1-like [Macrobrachium nipponense]|uniref:facilitated trehalose transporter Tret1-like n=1 Tax=Macrobrachium nipponense TaxID=159736 RepID=UPI0030C8753A